MKIKVWFDKDTEQLFTDAEMQEQGDNFIAECSAQSTCPTDLGIDDYISELDADELWGMFTPEAKKEICRQMWKDHMDYDDTLYCREIEI
jgi:hypothetical protein